MLKNRIKKYLPNFLKKIILSYLNKSIQNFYKTSYRQTALLSYIVMPFKKSSLSHTNYYEVQSWAKILSELGYNVDIIHYESSKKIDLSK